MKSEGKGASCFICKGSIPLWYFVMWCDECLDKLTESGLSIEEFKEREGANHE